jgi:hypothetical protein
MELPQSGVNGSRSGARIISIAHGWGFAVFDPEPVAHAPELGMAGSGVDEMATAHFSLNHARR